jgi:glycosyltransferase involved in cell wall biosynthesis
LEESLKSVFNQNDKNFEFILIDDCATDKVKTIVKRFDFSKLNAFQYIVYNQTLGHSNSYNDGLKIAKGSYAYYMGSNVVLFKDFVKTINKILQDYPDVGVISFTNENRKSDKYTVFTAINEKAHKITKKSLSNKILSIDFLNKHNIRLNDNHYYPLLYIYAIISHLDK